MKPGQPLDGTDSHGMPVARRALARATGRPSHRQTGRQGAGQAVVEFAILLPLILSIVGGALDFSRVFIVDLKVQSATRNAAESIASDITITDSTTALTRAQQLVCTEITGSSSCSGSSAPVATVTSFSVSTTALGATVKNPIATVTVNVSQPFDMLFPWPFMSPPGHWTMNGTSTFSLVRGR